MFRALLACFLLMACGDDDVVVDAGTDAGFDADNDGGVDGGAPTCLDPADTLMFPTPHWESDGAYRAPTGHRALELLQPRPMWEPQLDALDGWPHRPTIVVALHGSPTEVNGDAIALFGDDGDTLVELDVPLAVSLEAGALVIIPEDPIPTEHTRVVVAIGDDAVVGGVVVPACEGTAPHPDYATTAARLEGDWAMAIGFPLASIHTELPALYEALREAPALVIESSAVLDPDDAERVPTDEVLAAARTPIVDGIGAVPAYQGADGRFVVVDGVPVMQDTTRPGFTVLLPATGTLPFPWVIYQHGGGGHRHEALQNVAPHLEAGFAVIAVDLPAHGSRIVGEGGDLDILDFDDPLRSRDNLRQGSADHLAWITGVDALNAALQPYTGEDATLGDRIYYTGMSLGGITGSMTFASATDLRAAALFVGGGGYQEILSDGLFRAILGDVIRGTRLDRIAVAGLAAVFLEGADPLVYGAAEQSATRPLLFFEAIDDPIVPNSATDRWARAFGADLAIPFDHEVLGMETVALPATQRLLVQAPMSEVSTLIDRHGALIATDYAAQAVAHCFETDRDGDACELIDTGWADR